MIGIDRHTGCNFAVACTEPDGRPVYRVPEEKWLVSTYPELEVECMVCGGPIRFNAYVDSTQTATRMVPKAHAGACYELLKSRKIQERSIKNRLKRQQGCKRVSRKRIEMEFAKLKVKKLS